MSSIVTFFSYKGGVGRSMALANVAVLLARRGLRVLAVDWDLEAPGLERYFSTFSMEPRSTGLLKMFVDAAKGKKPNYRDYVWEVGGKDEKPFLFLSSGRDQDSEYSKILETFDWVEFFGKQKGGQFVEELRTQWRKDFDFVLIDSRTGLSDTGGICTIQLPDVVVAMFTANHQSLYGTRDVMRLAQQARQTLAYERMPLTVLPLPSRFGTRAEFQEGQDWLVKFQDALHEFFDDWLPSTMQAKDVLERIKIPQVDYFAFGEKLAVVEQGTNDPEGMGFVYDKVATLLASNFADLAAIVGHDVLSKQQTLAKEKPKRKSRAAVEHSQKDYRYDLFISYGHSSTVGEWVQGFLDLLRRELQLYLPSEMRIWFDLTELSPNMILADQARDALLHSKLLLAFVTPIYFHNKFSVSEYLTFAQRSEVTQSPRVLSIVLRGGANQFPQFFSKYQYYDLSKAALTGRKGLHSREVSLQVRNIGSEILAMLEKTPPLDPNWPEVSPAEAEDLISHTVTPVPLRDL